MIIQENVVYIYDILIGTWQIQFSQLVVQILSCIFLHPRNMSDALSYQKQT